jgi:hypothetical protein
MLLAGEDLMRKLSFVLFCLSLLFVTAARATSVCDRPHFMGEVYAATIPIHQDGEAVVYWVFDRDAFYEYLYFTGSGETKLIATAHYLRGAHSYLIEVPRNAALPIPGRRLATVTELRPELDFDEVSLGLPSGERMMRMLDAQQWIPPLTLAAGTTGVTVQASENDTCCCLCWQVHSFLGISFLDGICCFFVGGCSNASGFCGSGSGGVF